MKIMIVIPTLRHGGAERVATLLANFWASHGKQVIVASFEPSTAHDYPVRSEVARFSIGGPGEHARLYEKVFRLIVRLWTLRSAVREHAPDIVIGFMPAANVSTSLVCLGLRCRTIGSERVHPPHFPLKPIWMLTRRLTYRLLSAVVVQTRDNADWFKKNIPTRKLAVIPNAVKWPIAAFEPVVAPDSICPPGQKILLAVGRLDQQKGFTHLLTAFSEVSRTRADWSLVILGDGPSRTDLQQQAERTGIAERVLMPGYVGNVADWYRRASIFVLSSLFEGFPNVLAEAMASGLPTVSFDCDTGPRDIIRPGIDGLLVPAGDTAALAKALARLMDDDGLREQMAAHAIEARVRFSEATVMRQWDELFAVL